MIREVEKVHGKSRPQHISWSSCDIVEERDECTLNDLLAEFDVDELVRRYVHKDLPVHNLSESQALVMVRCILRDKLGGDDSFSQISAMGSIEEEKAIAFKFEAIMADFLDANGIRVKTELELKEDHKSANSINRNVGDTKKFVSFTYDGKVDSKGRKLYSGRCECGKVFEVPFKPVRYSLNPPKCNSCRALLTPDFLLIDDLFINGEKIAWIDCKCSYGAKANYFRRQMQEQVDKYTERWGKGALVFAFGFCDAHTLDNVLVLDASPLDLSELYELIDITHIGRRSSSMKATLTSTVAECRTSLPKKMTALEELTEASNGKSVSRESSSLGTRSTSRVYRGVGVPMKMVAPKENEHTVPRPSEPSPSLFALASSASPVPSPRHWFGNEDVINEMNCEEFGMNEYCYEKYGGMLGFDAWYDGY